MEDSKQEGRQFRDELKKKLQDIEARRLEAQKMRQLENEKKEKARIKKIENMTMMYVSMDYGNQRLKLMKA